MSRRKNYWLDTVQCIWKLINNYDKGPFTIRNQKDFKNKSTFWSTNLNFANWLKFLWNFHSLKCFLVDLKSKLIFMKFFTGQCFFSCYSLRDSTVGYLVLFRTANRANIFVFISMCICKVHIWVKRSFSFTCDCKIGDPI